MQKFAIDANVANAIGIYLMQRPMGEVEQLVMALRALKPITGDDVPATMQVDAK